jgi:hypothetical protein
MNSVPLHRTKCNVAVNVHCVRLLKLQRISDVSAGFGLIINAFPSGQVLKEYCRSEAMSVLSNWGAKLCIR